ncbi:hypothetical protein CGMCC3_g4389 [Colletotrichum fructicola]|nr:uncharacterized protein CGMCC3_g4389 [Colletotrichum fructicola]KAE9579614.1 hypothetical protein CGMCC3_g4389 [Colletotrichum fructicola]
MTVVTEPPHIPGTSSPIYISHMQPAPQTAADPRASQEIPPVGSQLPGICPAAPPKNITGMFRTEAHCPS